MALQQKAIDRRRRLAPADLRFNRTIGAIALLIGAMFVWSLVFSSFDVSVRFQWVVTPDGGRTPLTHITCPSPWSVLVNDAEPQVTTTDGLCVMPSRSLAVEGALVAGVSAIVAAWFFSRTKQPAPIHDLPFERDRGAAP